VEKEPFVPPNELFELIPANGETRFSGVVLTKKRLLLGRSENCDVVFHDSTVSAIHAVVEVTPGGAIVYDLNSTNGTFVNGKKIVTEKVSEGDQVRFGLIEVSFKKYAMGDVLPPVLDSLAPKSANHPHRPLPKQPLVLGGEEKLAPTLQPPTSGADETISEDLPPAPEKSSAIRELPQKPIIEESDDGIPYVSYPLASDPKAEFSEYIFEDLETLYPIFKYDVTKSSVEVVIINDENIISVDYLPGKDGVFGLVGYLPKDKDVEFAYLGKNERLDFVTISGNQVSVLVPHSYSVLYLDKEGNRLERDDIKTDHIDLKENEILSFRNGDLQIFVRNTEAPPKVKAAPVFRRDKTLGKYFLIIFLFLLSFLSVLTFIDIDEEIEKEKAPERIATILYKKKLIVPKKKSSDYVPSPKKKTPKTPKRRKAVKPTTTKAAKKIVKKVAKTTHKSTTPKAVKKVTPKKATTKRPKKVVRKKTQVAPKKTKKIGGKPNAGAASRRRARNTKSKGRVDTYKSTDFSSTMNSLLAKGGSATGVQTQNAASGDTGLTTTAIGGSEATAAEIANVEQKVGSLTGAADGKLAASKGAEGLVDKKSVMTAGIPSKTVVLGSMDPDIIRKILRDHLPQFQRCYQNELDATYKKIQGVIPLNFTIGSSGHVVKAGLRGASRFPPGMVNCTLSVLRGITFPEPLGGGKVEVNQPLNFLPRK
jgi:outer membrane biosynthesis protein TonB